MLTSVQAGTEETSSHVPRRGPEFYGRKISRKENVRPLINPHEDLLPLVAAAVDDQPRPVSFEVLQRHRPHVRHETEALSEPDQPEGNVRAHDLSVLRIEDAGVERLHVTVSGALCGPWEPANSGVVAVAAEFDEGLLPGESRPHALELRFGAFGRCQLRAHVAGDPIRRSSHQPDRSEAGDDEDGNEDVDPGFPGVGHEKSEAT